MIFKRWNSTNVLALSWHHTDRTATIIIQVGATIRRPPLIRAPASTPPAEAPSSPLPLPCGKVSIATCLGQYSERRRANSSRATHYGFDIARPFNAPSVRLHAANALLLAPIDLGPSALPDVRGDRFQIPNDTNARSTPNTRMPRHNRRAARTARLAPVGAPHH